MNADEKRMHDLAALDELEPDDKPRILELERQLRKLSNWSLRDSIREFCENMDSGSAATEESMNDRDWLSVAWTILDILKDAEKMRDAICALVPEGEIATHEDMKEWPSEDWQYEVNNGDTKLGYLEWVSHKKED